MTGVVVGWSAPSWIGFSDQDYSKILHRRALAVTRRDKRRGGNYTVKQAIEAINQAFHRCNGFDPYDQFCWSRAARTYDNQKSKEKGAAYKREMAMLPTVDHVKAEPLAEFEIVSWQTNDAKGEMRPEEFVAYCRRVVQVADRQ